MEQGRFATAIPLGRGASGTVYRAFDARLGHDVALKVIPVRDAQAAARVQREVRVQASLQHPDICRVHGLEQHQGEWVLVLQLIEGESFESLMPREPLSVRLALLARIARAVQHAHDQGIVHRDLKPSNVLVGRDPDGCLHPYLSDFGLARGAQDTRLTVTGGALGTPAYMSPEQVRGDSIDSRVDIYALGAIAYQCIAGRTPFDDVSGDLATAILRRDPPPLPAKAALRAVVGKAMEKRPARRYASADEFADDLDRARLEQPTRAQRDAPKRRALAWLDRHHIAALASLAALAVVVVLAAQQWQLRAQTLQAQLVAREFAQHAERAASLMRSAQLLPPHDLGIERAQVEAAARALVASGDSLGAQARGPVALSMARVGLAMDRPLAVLEQLDAAAGHGLPDSALDPLRLLALDAAFEQESARLESLADRDLVRAEAERLRQRYLEPSGAALARMAARGALSPLDQARQLQLQGRTNEALDLIAGLHPDSDLERLPQFRFEARLRYRSSIALWLEGDLESAKQQLDAAIGLLDRALLIARSDGALWSLRCRAAGQSYALNMERLGAAAALDQPLHPACDTALIVEPRDLAAREARAVAGWRLARWQLRYQRTWTDALAAFEQSLRTDLAAFVRSPGLSLALGGLLTSAAELRRDRGEPAGKLLDEASHLFDTALAEQPRNLALLVGSAMAWNAQAKLLAEQPASAALQRSIERYRAALVLAPAATAVRNSLAVMLSEFAYAEFGAGRSAEPFLSEALAQLEQAHAQRPEHLSVMVNLALAQWTAAEVAAAANTDPAQHFERAVLLSEAVLTRDPERSYALLNLGGILTAQAEWQLAQGRDAQPSLRAARAAREQLHTLAGDSLAIPCDWARLLIAETAAGLVAAEQALVLAEQHAREGRLRGDAQDCDAMLVAVAEQRLEAGMDAVTDIEVRAGDLAPMAADGESRARFGRYLLLAARRFDTHSQAAEWRLRGRHLLDAARLSHPHLAWRVPDPGDSSP